MPKRGRGADNKKEVTTQAPEQQPNYIFCIRCNSLIPDKEYQSHYTKYHSNGHKTATINIGYGIKKRTKPK